MGDDARFETSRVGRPALQCNCNSRCCEAADPRFVPRKLEIGNLRLEIGNGRWWMELGVRRGLKQKLKAEIWKAEIPKSVTSEG
jgi:hypothetical protein